MITISYPDLALLGGLDPATGEVRGMSTSVYPDACFPQRNISVILIFIFFFFFWSQYSFFIFKDH